MYQLRALIWKSYKVRVRSPYSTALDLLGPQMIILLYVAIKFLMNQTSAPQVEEQTKDMKFFRNVEQPINIRQDLGRHLCPRILYFSDGAGAGPQGPVLELTLRDECGFQLIKSPSRASLVEALRRSLDQRMFYQQKGANLNKLNETDNCITLPQTGGDIVYQIGLVLSDGNNVEIHSTDSVGSSVINMPYSQGSPYNEYKLPQSDLNLATHLVEICLSKAFTKLLKNVTSPNQTDPSEVRWRFKPFPVVTGIYILPIGTEVAVMLACLCTNVATVLRISEANELRLHRYIRVAGLPAPCYWLDQQTVMAMQALAQSLLLSILLAIPTGDYLYDPISEASMTLRWMIIFAYSLASNSNSAFIASVFERSGQALLTLCTIGSMYAMYPILLLLQWSPLGFTSFYPLNYVALSNPAANFQTLCQVIVAVALQTNQTFGWIHLDNRIINGGMTRLSSGELLLFLLAQTLFWTSLTILVDQYRYSTANNIFGFLCALLNELCFSNCCCAPNNEPLSDSDLKTKSTKTAQSRRDPNRICCSLRQVAARGATILMPYTEGKPLKFSHEYLRDEKGGRTVSKTTEHLINRRQPDTKPYDMKRQVESTLLGKAIRQNIAWYSTEVKFESLDLDFRYNQISFVLGQTNFKDLLFDVILGLRLLDSGSIIIDGVKYTASTLNLARRQIGYLSAKDIFFNELTIFENLQFFGSMRQPSYKSYTSESLYILNLLHLSSRRANVAATLSHRAARKLALGVASVGQTKLLLLTEPTANLQWRPKCQVYNLLKKYKSIRSIVIDSSDVDEAVAFGDRILLLKNGSANLNGSPDKLERRLACGYWLVFAPASVGDGRSVNSAAIKALDKLTSDLFQRDKIDLAATKRSIYHKLNDDEINSNADPQVAAGRTPSGGSKLMTHDDDIHHVIFIVKVHHTVHSTRALCTLLKMFASQSSIYGFRLAQLSYESLEDILVLRMSRAVYPDLPPDLLLSLQYRTQENNKMQEQSSVSVRPLNRNHLATSPSSTNTPEPIFSSDLATIIKDRLSLRSEIITILAAFIGALTIILLALLAMQNSLGSADVHVLPNVTSKSSTNLKQVGYQQEEQATSVADTLLKFFSWKNGSLFKYGQNRYVHHKSLPFDIVERLYKYRVGLYFLEKSSNSSLMDTLKRWNGNKEIVGTIDLFRDKLHTQTDAQIVADLIHNSKDIASSFVIYNPTTNEATVVFEPYLPHVMMASIKKFINYNLAPYAFDMTSNVSRTRHEQTFWNDLNSPTSSSWIMRDQDERPPVYTTSMYYFYHPWHEMIKGYANRRMIYGVGFALAESLAMGVLVLAPTRHRTESRLERVQANYWFSMAFFDMTLSLLLIVGYIFLFITIEGLNSGSLIGAMFIVLFAYKLASLPIPYMVSIATEYPVNGFLFIVLIYITISWDFAIFLRTFVEWTLITNNYLYTIANWILFGMPITALIDSLTVINQINNINNRCRDVPAYMRTVNRVELEGVRRLSIIDNLYDKVRECLASGKMSIETDVMHQQSLGILWFIYLIILFGLIAWTFLLTSERLFGIVARRFNSARTTGDPMKITFRLPDKTGSLFQWGRERDRLISEYIKCMNDIEYVRCMATNCLILRIWLKPMGDQTSIDKRLSNLLEPLFGLGHSKNDIQIELRTTLQIFIRIGDESRRCRVDKIQLIEIYTKYAELHADSVAKIAVVDWTRENLYKIVLHGHYNTKITAAV